MFIPEFLIEESPEIAATIPREIFAGELSPIARLILLTVFAKGNGKISLSDLTGINGCNLARHSWLKYSAELERKGWLTRKNSSMGRSKFIHERTFHRKPKQDPLA